MSSVSRQPGSSDPTTFEESFALAHFMGSPVELTREVILQEVFPGAFPDSVPVQVSMSEQRAGDASLSLAEVAEFSF